MFESKETKEAMSILETNITNIWNEWENGNKDNFENRGFTEAMINWRNQHHPKTFTGKFKQLDNTYYGLEITEKKGLKALATHMTKSQWGDQFLNLKEIDFKDELPIYMRVYSGNGFILTNKKMYMAFSGEKTLDTGIRVYNKNFNEIKSFKIKMAIAHAIVEVNNESLGSWTFSDDDKKFCRLLCDSIAARCIEFSASASQSGGSDTSQLDKLSKLKSLLDSGALSQEEFDEQKKKILEDL